jgi:hypothetical protein
LRVETNAKTHSRYSLAKIYRKIADYSSSPLLRSHFFFMNHKSASNPITNSLIFMIFFISLNISYFTKDI